MAVTIPQYQAQLELRQQELERAERQIQEFDPRVALTQRQLRERREPLKERIQAEEVERQRRLAKSKSVSELQKAFVEQKRLEVELKPVMAQYKSYQRGLAERKAYERALKHYKKGTSASWFQDEPKVQDYMQEMYKQRSVAKQSLAQQVRKFEEKYPTEKLMVDWKNLRITGATSAALKMSFPTLKGYQKELGRAVPTAPKFDIRELAMPQAPGTFDPVTRVYISPEGVGQTIAPGYEPPPEARIITAPPRLEPLPPEPSFIEVAREEGIIPAIEPYVKEVVEKGR